MISLSGSACNEMRPIVSSEDSKILLPQVKIQTLGVELIPRLMAFLLSCFFISLSPQLFGQESYNLPPNFVIYEKTFTYKDYSYKLNNQPDFSTVSITDEKFMKDLTPENFKDMERNDPDSFVYYTEALDFYKSLSDTVKAIYTGDELWYIYMFDQNLKSKLTTLR
jgi:hypothetical protein